MTKNENEKRVKTTKNKKATTFFKKRGALKGVFIDFCCCIIKCVCVCFAGYSVRSV